MLLNGPVEIDECLLYKMKRGNVGRLCKTKVWIFGLKCRTTKKYIFYLLFNRTRRIIQKILLRHINKNSVIISDCFSAYVNNRIKPKFSYLKELGYFHLYVNHSISFVSGSQKDIHTKGIERTWKSLI